MPNGGEPRPTLAIIVTRNLANPRWLALASLSRSRRGANDSRESRDYVEELGVETTCACCRYGTVISGLE